MMEYNGFREYIEIVGQLGKVKNTVKGTICGEEKLTYGKNKHKDRSKVV